jgi:hypothetical protein
MPVAGAVIGAAGSLFGGKQSSDAAAQAAQTQAASADASNKLNWNIFQQSRADQAPWQQAGQNALARMMEEMGFGVSFNPSSAQPGMSGPGSTVSVGGGKAGTVKKLLTGADTFLDPMGFFASPKAINMWMPPDTVQGTSMFNFTPQGNGKKLFNGFQADPGYQFRLKEGQNAMNNALAARGGLLSGAAVKAGQKYASDLASQEYGNYFNRLSSLAGIGQTANNTVANLGQNVGQTVGNNMLQAGNARASGYAAQGQAMGNTFNQLGNIFGGMKFGNGTGNTSAYKPGYTYEA